MEIIGSAITISGEKDEQGIFNGNGLFSDRCASAG
jgi:hypothetical protein